MSDVWDKLYRVVPVTADTTSCLIIPSTDGCCEIPMVAEIVEPCEHGNYAQHINEDEDISEGGSQIYFEYCSGKPNGKPKKTAMIDVCNCFEDCVHLGQRYE